MAATYIVVCADLLTLWYVLIAGWTAIVHAIDVTPVP